MWKTLTNIAELSFPDYYMFMMETPITINNAKLSITSIL